MSIKEMLPIFGIMLLMVIGFAIMGLSTFMSKERFAALLPKLAGGVIVLTVLCLTAIIVGDVINGKYSASAAIMPAFVVLIFCFVIYKLFTASRED